MTLKLKPTKKNSQMSLQQEQSNTHIITQENSVDRIDNMADSQAEL